MNYTPEQARDWCYEVRVKPLPISSAIPIMQSLADQVERLTDENRDLRTAKALLRPAEANNCAHHNTSRRLYTGKIYCDDCGAFVRHASTGDLTPSDGWVT